MALLKLQLKKLSIRSPKTRTLPLELTTHPHSAQHTEFNTIFRTYIARAAFSGVPILSSKEPIMPLANKINCSLLSAAGWLIPVIEISQLLKECMGRGLVIEEIRSITVHWKRVIVACFTKFPIKSSGRRWGESYLSFLSNPRGCTDGDSVLSVELHLEQSAHRRDCNGEIGQKYQTAIERLEADIE